MPKSKQQKRLEAQARSSKGGVEVAYYGQANEAVVIITEKDYNTYKVRSKLSLDWKRVGYDDLAKMSISFSGISPTPTADYFMVCYKKSYHSAVDIRNHLTGQGLSFVIVVRL